jgi:hypothetical protein
MRAKIDQPHFISGQDGSVNDGKSSVEEPI